MASVTHAAVFGRNPALSVAELHALSGRHGFGIRPLGKYAAELTGFEPKLAERLGSVTKLFELRPDVYRDARAGLEAAAAAVPAEGKFAFGVSSYANDKATPLAMHVKRFLKERGVRSRSVGKPKGKSGRPEDGELSAVQVRHNGLISPGADWGVFGTDDGYHVGRTVWVYDFEGFGARDYDKPVADAKRGMLPPQLARTMVNLATQGDPGLAVYDPFCGVGNLLLESLLLGHRTIGSDITPDAVDAARRNLAWLRERHPKLPESEVSVRDATGELPAGSSSAIATEGYLGSPLRESAKAGDMGREATFVETMVGKFLQRAADSLPSGRRLVLTLPAWRTPGSRTPIRITTIDQAERLGYAVIRPLPEGFSFPELTDRDSIDVARAKQRVIHELFILERN
ncbi:MAG TPA: hypothetical protein VIF43_03270 [Patescibacteria group bacterium]|jgi:tRNA G10  N-methylase Trm11